jgi:hypothetical protein
MHRPPLQQDQGNATAPTERRFPPPIGRSPSKISGGARQPRARAVALSAHPIPRSTKATPYAAIGRDGWTKLCIFTCVGKRGGSTKTQQPGKQGDGDGISDHRGARHATTVVAWREERRHVGRR